MFENFQIGRIGVPRLVIATLIIDIALACIYLADRAFGQPLGEFVSLQFDVGKERNVPTWYSTVKLFLVGFLLLLLTESLAKAYGATGWPMVGLALAFIGLSLDELVGFHEQAAFLIDQALLPTGDRADTLFRSTGVWMFVLIIPTFLIMLKMVWSLNRVLRNPRATWTFILGLTVFLGGAFSDVLMNFTTGIARVLQVGAEEFMEMLGVTIILWAVLQLMADRGLVVVRESSTHVVSPGAAGSTSGGPSEGWTRGHRPAQSPGLSHTTDEGNAPARLLD